MLRHNKTDVLGFKCMANVSPTLHGNYCQKVISNNLNNNSSNSNINNIKATTSGGSALPKQFVVSMKKLFDILDDQHSGLVKFTDIEKGWHDDGCKGLPRGVIDSLRKVTPASGLLSFDRFCAGLKICLLRNQTTDATTLVVNNNKLKLPKKPPRPPSAPLLEIENPLPTTSWSTNPTATVRPQNIIGTQRALSLPQLSPDSAEIEQEEELDAQTTARGGVTNFNSPPPPPKPPRSAANMKTGAGILTTTNNGVAPLGKAEIRHALQNWQMGVLLNEMDLKDKRSTSYGQNQFPPYRGCADGGSSSTTDSTTPSIALYSKKLNSNKRREPRRHTLQNGIDYNMLKRLKQFEEEREVLLLGLDAVDRAREWYVQQIASLQEKIQYLGHMGTHVVSETNPFIC